MNNTFTLEIDLSGNSNGTIVQYNFVYPGSMLFRNKTATTKKIRRALTHGNGSLYELDHVDIILTYRISVRYQEKLSSDFVNECNLDGIEKDEI